MTSTLPRASVFKLDNVLCVCEDISVPARRRYQKKYGDECNPEQALLIWVADSLSVLPFDLELRSMIVDDFEKEILAIGKEIWETLEKRYKDPKQRLQFPVSYIGIGDRRYVAITGNAKMLDITSGELIDGNSKQFLETIQYNLAQLFMRRYLSLKQQGSKDEPSNTSKATKRA